MSDMLAIGVRLLVYVEEFYRIAEQIEEAGKIAREVKESLMEEIYQGEALEPMQEFAVQLEKHMEKLGMLYAKGAESIVRTFEHSYSDEIAMALWFLRKLQDDGGVA